MTQYEILDLRATYGDRLTSMAKFWLTLTFAVFGGAYYLKDHPDLFSQVALVVFYGATSLICVQTILSIVGFIHRLAQIESQSSATSASPDPASSRIAAPKASQTVNILFIVMGITFVAYCFYTFRSV